MAFRLKVGRRSNSWKLQRDRNFVEIRGENEDERREALA